MGTKVSIWRILGSLRIMFQQHVLQLKFNHDYTHKYAAEGTVSFYLKGTCEEHDELNVYYDGENWISSRDFYTGSKITGWSSWTSQSVDLSAGNHTLTFNYRKDNETNGGDDRFCIDDLSLSFD